MKKKKIVDVGLHPSEIELRLKNLCVFGVVDANSALIYNNNSALQLCPFFFRQSTASAYRQFLNTIKQDLKIQIHITKVDLGRYTRYTSHCAVKNSNTKNIVCCLVPDFSEVKNAIQLNTQCNHESRAFIGVPLFQAQSLRIKTIRPTCARTYKTTPFFLNKNGVEDAILYSYSVKERRRVHQIELKVYTKKIRNTPKLNKIFAKPICEVTCLEWVLQQLEADKEGAWTQVSFITPGLVKFIKTTE